MLHQRVITAALILPPVCLVLWVGGGLLTVFCLVVFFISAFEFFSFSKLGTFPLRLQASLCSMLPALAFLVYGAQGALAGFVLGFVLLMSIQLVSIESAPHQPHFKDSIPASTFGFAYLGVLSVPVVAITMFPDGNLLMAWLIAVVACTDTTAYFGGKLFGKAKMSPRISPNKTRVGALFGLVGAALASWGMGLWLLPHLNLVHVVIVGCGVGVLGEIGDLVESLAKRIYEVKDSGTTLPGHGGILDRVDAMIFAAPILFCL